MLFRPKKFHRIFAIYWVLLGYIVAALIFWFITLNQQNNDMRLLRLQQAIERSASPAQMSKIEADHDRKVKQYLGEGITFLIIIFVGAILVYRAVKKQLKLSNEQQHFMMAVTHELKTPIAVAQLNLETIQKRKLDEEQRQRLLQNTLHETNRLNTLCNNLLLSSQIEAEGYKILEDEINFSLLVQECINDFIRRFPQRDITAGIEENIILEGDSNLLQILVNNLIENALKYSPKETVVDVSLQRKTDLIWLAVADSGTGISNTDKQKIFEKFFRLGNEATKRAKGTGLGLYLCKKIVTRHKGRIGITDNPGGGSIFTVQLHPTD
ncbi:MAG: ATP-binding protein [Ferruginibacter sp.]